MLTWPPSWKARSSSRPSAGLPRRDAVVGRLDAVVDGVADQVGQRVVDGLDDASCRARSRCPSISRRDLLAAGDREVADDARELVPDVADRLHARLHDALLQLGRDRFSRCAVPTKRGVLAGRAELQDLVAGEHELADQVHQLVEQADVDADRAVRDGAAGLLGRRLVAARRPLRGAPARPAAPARAAARRRRRQLVERDGSRLAVQDGGEAAPPARSSRARPRCRCSRCRRACARTASTIASSALVISGVEGQLAVAQARQQALADVGDRLEGRRSRGTRRCP